MYSNGKGNPSPHDIHAGEIYAETVIAKQFVLVDKQNKTRISLHIAQDGSPCIAVYDQNEHMRLELNLEETGNPSIILRSEGEAVQASLTIDDDQFPYLRLYDNKPQLRACLYIAEDTPAITIYDREEKLRWSFTLEPEEQDKPYVLFYNNGEQRQIALTVPTDGSEGLLLQNREGEDRSV